MKRKIGLASLALLLIAAMCMPAMAWSSGGTYSTHGYSAWVAAQKSGISTSNVVPGASAPDTWGLAEILTHGSVTAPAKAQSAALAARYAYQTGDPSWTTSLGYSMHYITDMSMPWHSNSAFWIDRNIASYNSGHDAYEGEYWSQNGGALRTDMYYGATSPNYVASPYVTAQVAATLSSYQASYLFSQWVTNPNWKTDYSVYSTVSSLLKDETKNCWGLVNWVRH